MFGSSLMLFVLVRSFTVQSHLTFLTSWARLCISTKILLHVHPDRCSNTEHELCSFFVRRIIVILDHGCHRPYPHLFHFSMDSVVNYRHSLYLGDPWGIKKRLVRLNSLGQCEVFPCWRKRSLRAEMISKDIRPHWLGGTEAIDRTVIVKWYIPEAGCCIDGFRTSWCGQMAWLVKGNKTLP